MNNTVNDSAADQPESSVPMAVRVVGDAETLRVLSDPIRMGILRVLMAGPADRPRVLSVKEIAEQLGEPPTKLYRHVKQLAERELIRVAETRIVSGIVEQRYQTGQLSLNFDRHFLGQHVADDETGGALAATIDSFRDEMITAIRTGRVPLDTDIPDTESYRRFLLSRNFASVPPVKAIEFHDRLAALVDEMIEDGYDDDGVEVHFLAAFYVPTYPDE